MKRIFLLILFSTLLLVSCERTNTPEVTKLIYGPDYPNTEYVENINVGVNAETPEEAITYFGTDILKCLYNGEDNVLISPASVFFALSMTETGAKGNTFEQLEKALGRGIPFEEMTAFGKSFTETYKNNKYIQTGLANSLWIRDDESAIEVHESFVEKTKENFDAEVFTEKFDSFTKDKINNWVKEKTDSMIDEIIDNIDKETVMYLINAMFFDGEWQSIYYEDSVTDDFKFTNVKGEEEIITGMSSTEWTFLSDENTTGFVKNYKGGQFGFAVLLPNEDISINDYVKGLDGDKITKLLENKKEQKVYAKMPKFKFGYTANLNETLKVLGITDAFDATLSDLSGIGTTDYENLYISKVLHKTYIEVAEKGTKAAAVTAVAVDGATAAAPQKIEYVTVDRPYLFMIIDNNSNLPIFMGAVLSVE